MSTDEEFGGVHQIERRSGLDRRSSNWKDAVEQWRAERAERYTALLAALGALEADMRHDRFKRKPSEYWADRLARMRR